jgi:hypothetical protein
MKAYFVKQLGKHYIFKADNKIICFKDTFGYLNFVEGYEYKFNGKIVQQKSNDNLIFIKVDKKSINFTHYPQEPVDVSLTNEELNTFGYTEYIPSPYPQYQQQKPIFKKHTFNNKTYYEVNPLQVNINRTYIYLIRLFNDSENFYKVGITVNPRERFNALYDETGYNIEVINIGWYSLLNKAKEMEQSILNKFRKYRYTPHIQFSGLSECLSISPL